MRPSAILHEVQQLYNVSDRLDSSRAMRLSRLTRLANPRTEGL
jgi:hypothetical protein